MTPNTDPQQLSKLLNFLKNDLLARPENKWAVDDLRRYLAPKHDDRITEIHELCVEEILQRQAEDFYKDFAIEDLKEQLVSDFVKMEHWRRRNNFLEFAMALYQQIEAIVNYLVSDSYVQTAWYYIRNFPFFADVKAKNIRIRAAESKSIKRSVIFNSENRDKPIQDQLAMDKFKAILYLIAYQTDVTWNTKTEFNSDFFTGYYIYLLRNMNHRGSQNTLKREMQEHITQVLSNPTHSMLYYLGFYSKFVSKINAGYPFRQPVVDFVLDCSRKLIAQSQNAES